MFLDMAERGRTTHRISPCLSLQVGSSMIPDSNSSIVPWRDFDLLPILAPSVSVGAFYVFFHDKHATLPTETAWCSLPVLQSETRLRLFFVWYCH